MPELSDITTPESDVSGCVVGTADFSHGDTRSRVFVQAGTPEGLYRTICVRHLGRKRPLLGVSQWIDNTQSENDMFRVQMRVGV